jgi:hypothetical protein
MYGLFYECKFLTIEETNKKKRKKKDGRHSAVALLLKAAMIQVSDYRLLGASGLVHLAKGNVSFCHHLASVVR